MGDSYREEIKKKRERPAWPTARLTRDREKAAARRAAIKRQQGREAVYPKATQQEMILDAG